MSELRYNMITGEWVIIAKERARRPHDFIDPRKKPRQAPPFDPGCAFCPGNEASTQGESLRLPAKGAWKVRVVPNKFPALSPDQEVSHQCQGYQRSISGFGYHEVIIESPAHHLPLARLPLAQLELVLSSYRERMLAFYRDSSVEHVIVFKNHGETAGSSLTHPHSQIVGTPIMPGQVRRRFEHALQYYADSRACVFCTCLEQELAEGARIISQNSSFVGLIPYAALSPFHQWILPRKHSGCFAMISDEELSDLAVLLKDLLSRIDLGLSDPDFNYVVRSLSPSEREVRYFHWYISIVPRITQTAGFELGTGMFVNASLPEESARFLREVPLPP